MAHLTTKQIKQLIEIDGAGPGIREEVQAIIARLTSGGVGPKSDDPRVVQTKRLWNKGFGRELGICPLDAYRVTIPKIPECLLAHDDRFPELILVDARLGIVTICDLLGLEYSGTDHTFEDFDPKKSRSKKVYWMRAQDGKKNRKKSVRTCLKEFASDELGLTAHEGLAFYAQNPETFRQSAMSLTASVIRNDIDYTALLSLFGFRPALHSVHNSAKDPGYGSGSRRE